MLSKKKDLTFCFCYCRYLPIVFMRYMINKTWSRWDYFCVSRNIICGERKIILYKYWDNGIKNWTKTKVRDNSGTLLSKRDDLDCGRTATLLNTYGYYIYCENTIIFDFNLTNFNLSNVPLAKTTIMLL